MTSNRSHQDDTSTDLAFSDLWHPRLWYLSLLPFLIFWGQFWLLAAIVPIVFPIDWVDDSFWLDGWPPTFESQIFYLLLYAYIAWLLRFYRNSHQRLLAKKRALMEAASDKPGAALGPE